MKCARIKFDHEDSQWLEGKKFQRPETESRFNLPPHKVGGLAEGNQMKRAKIKCDAGEAEVFLYGEIGDSWGEGIDTESFVKDLAAFGEIKSIVVRINSPGGDVFDASAIFAAIRRLDAEVRVSIDGLAASAAALIAMAGDTIEIAENAMIMIHNPATFVLGGSTELRAAADLLDKIQGQYVEAFASQCGKPEATIQTWMDAETWFTADEALDAGLADSKIAKKKVEAMVHLGRFRHTPREMLADGDTVIKLEPEEAWREQHRRLELQLLG